MKGITILIFCFLISVKSYSQDTLQTQDLSSAGDTFVISTATTFAGFNPTATGANYSWDFSGLIRTGQRIDTMLAVSSTNIAFAFFFGFGSNISNQATRGANLQLGGGLPGLSDVYNFYNNSTTEFKQTGFGALVSGIPLPIVYTPHDFIYRFPMIYGDSDSCNYSYEIDLASTIGAYFKSEKSRVNSIDGWGQLTTPFGTFSVLRIVSTIVEIDSIHLDTIIPGGIGFKLPPITTKEFKWMGKDFGKPLLQINTSGNDSISQILFQDSLHLNSIDQMDVITGDPLIYPNPASNSIFIQYTLNKTENVSYEMFTSDGRKIFTKKDDDRTAGNRFTYIDLTPFELPAGNYFLNIITGKSVISKPIIIGK